MNITRRYACTTLPKRGGRGNTWAPIMIDPLSNARLTRRPMLKYREQPAQWQADIEKEDTAQHNHRSMAVLCLISVPKLASLRCAMIVKCGVRKRWVKEAKNHAPKHAGRRAAKSNIKRLQNMHICAKTYSNRPSHRWKVRNMRG